MQLVTTILLYRKSFTICCISKEFFMLEDEKHYRTIGVNVGHCYEADNSIEDTRDKQKMRLKFTAPAYFLQPFVKECVNSEAYRVAVINNLSELGGYPENGVVFLKLILEPPDKEVIDYAWNERMLRLVWSRVEIENAFSWLSTLGGAYSALGDYFERCAEEAGRISIRQYKLAILLGDDGLAARSRLYSALSLSQKGNLKLARHIVRSVAEFGRVTHDKRLIRMCHGVWAKLRYLRDLKMNKIGHGNGAIAV